MTPRLLLLSAYDADSHRLWRQRLVKMFPDWHWEVATLPPRHFSWRIRSNSLHWALREQEMLNRPHDAVLATSMVDLASLRGLVPALAAVPSLLYFHENQFCYPPGAQNSDNIEPVLVPVYAALCANRLIFNSEYNRRSFLEGARSLFQKLPDRLGIPLLEQLPRSAVIPVPLDDAELSPPAQTKRADILEVAWNHRWEYDKGPRVLLSVVRRIVERDLPLRLHLFGQRFTHSPGEFAEIGALLQRWARHRGLAAGHSGFLESRSDYLQQLARCHVVLSTALHDFQGLAVQEACASGCTPLVPDALVYPEYLERQFRYRVEPDNDATVDNILKALLARHARLQAGLTLPTADMTRFTGSVLRAEYAAQLDDLMRAGGR